MASRMIERVLARAWEERERFATSDALVRHARDAAREAIEREAGRRREVTAFDQASPGAHDHPGSLELMSTEAVRLRLLERPGSRGVAVTTPAPTQTSPSNYERPLVRAGSSAVSAAELRVTDERFVPSGLVGGLALDGTPRPKPVTVDGSPEAAPRVAMPAVPDVPRPIPSVPEPGRHPAVGAPSPARAPAGPRVAAAAPGPAAGHVRERGHLRAAAYIKEAEAPAIPARARQVLAAVVVVVAVASWLLTRSSGEDDALAALTAELGPVTSTSPAQRAELTLADGSTARLGALASLASSPTFAEGPRALVVSGPVSLALKGEPSRPVAIATGPHQWVTTGARAAFDREGDQTYVAVDSGTVVLVNGPEEARIEAGRSVAMNAAGVTTPLDPATAEQHFGWRTGRLRLQGVTALALRDRLSQWFGLDLTFETPRSPAATVSVDLPLASTDSVVPALTKALNVPVERQGRVLVAGAPSAQAAPQRRSSPAGARRSIQLPKAPSLPKVP